MCVSQQNILSSNHSQTHARMHIRMHAHTHTPKTILRSLDFIQDNPGEPVTEKNIQPLTLTPIVVISHPLSAYSIYLRYTACPLFNLQFMCQTVFFTISLQVFFGPALGLAP